MTAPQPGVGGKLGGQWNPMTVGYAKQAGAWKHTKKVYAKKAGQWVEVWPSAPVWLSLAMNKPTFDWYGSTFEKPEYTKDANGFVRLRGLIKNFTGAAVPTSTTIATLPIGYRPKFNVRFLVETNGASQIQRTFDIYPDGRILNNGAMATNENGTFTQLLFFAEQ